MDAFVVLWLLSYEMDTTFRVQILDTAVCFSHNTNTFVKGKHSGILHPAMSKIVE